MYDWLDDDGEGLIVVYQPTYWKKVSDQKMYLMVDSKVERKDGYDEINNRMTDTWWEKDNLSKTYTQSLKCYSLDEIHAICQEVILEIMAYFPGGAMNFEKIHFNEVVSLSEGLSYQIKVKKKK